jgi:glycosyltransferase involved in cell wall biosynthesis
MRVTVVMPVYNAMPYLHLAVKSILEQSLRDLCLVAIDDGSTDGSLEYLYSVTDSRLTVVRMERNQGQGAARNRALQTCKTEYVAFQDADDVSLPTRLELQLSYLDRCPEIGMLGTRFAYIGRTGRPGLSPPLALDHTSIRRDLLLGRHAVANSTLAFRTSVFARTGLFRISGAGEDWDLFLRMTENTRVANMPQILCHYRVHGGNTNAQQARTLRLRYAHACECARQREAVVQESSFEDFCNRQSRRPLWHHWTNQLDQISASEYHGAVVNILEGAAVKGYGRLALASLLAPQRLVQRLSRKLRLFI